jgi:hypothetical protein
LGVAPGDVVDVQIVSPCTGTRPDLVPKPDGIPWKRAQYGRAANEEPRAPKRLG